MLAGMPNLSDEHRQLLQIVTRESERLNGIITDFLAYSRNRQYKLVEVDVLPLLEDTLTLLEHRLLAENTGIRIARIFLFPKPKRWLTGTRSNKCSGTSAKTPSAL